jgi:peptidoglycan/LPS O-acetylase OafA/YrhL
MSYINSLTGLRGMAAFIVFISHLAVIFCANLGRPAELGHSLLRIFLRHAYAAPAGRRRRLAQAT